MRYPITRGVHDVLAERDRQDAKWGEQNHHPMQWLAILSEEVGELAKEVNEHHWREKRDTLAKMRAELVQVAAVAVAWLECLNRGLWASEDWKGCEVYEIEAESGSMAKVIARQRRFDEEKAKPSGGAT